jgi:hypothetical protein
MSLPVRYLATASQYNFILTVEFGECVSPPPIRILLKNSDFSNFAQRSLFRMA